jgi:queuine tRNA-ribosyltransferase
MKNDFHLLRTCGNARAGELITPHGAVSTPAFMPVGSQGTIKALTPEEVRDIGYGLVLANTYHLYLRPGIEVVERLGGLHKFMGWDDAILTDSGGYQIFSLAPLCKVSEEGVVFRSHIDGSEHFFTPELAIEYQERLDADIMMVLDVCSAYDEGVEKVKQAMDTTHRWAERCYKVRKNQEQALYAIVQGGVFPELRRQSAEFLTTLDFDGYAIGGLSVGEPKQVTSEMLEATVPLLPEGKPRYLMGVGAPEDIVEGMARGIDIFDSALPTRVARNGALFTWEGRRNIRNAIFSRMDRPIVDECGCYTCRTFSAAYLQHLFKSEELLVYRLATIHNLYFIHDLMEKVRKTIIDGTFIDFREEFLSRYHPTDELTRITQKKKWLKAKGRKLDGGSGAP